MVQSLFTVVNGVRIFYREAGAPGKPVVLLLHGFPTSSHMFRNLIPLLANDFHVIAPDLPGFGFSDSPDRKSFAYTFDHLAEVIGNFVDALKLKRFAIYVFDYGAPIGWRLATAHPERISAIISQNGNGYKEGLSEGWNPIQKYWQDPTPANRDALRDFLKPEATQWQYTHGIPASRTIAPEAYTLDSALLARPGNDQIQLDLFLDYRNNIAQYPALHQYFAEHRPPLLAVWGRNDPFFLPAGAERFPVDNVNARVKFYDTGHFALETHVDEIGHDINEFLKQVLV